MQNAKSLEEAILKQAKEEAKKIVEEAKKKAEQILKNAEEEKNKKRESIRLKTIEEANRTVEQIKAKANAEAKKIILEKKAKLLAKVTEEAKKAMEKRVLGFNVEESIETLLQEALPMFPQEAKLRFFVNSKDLNVAKSILKKHKLSNSVDLETRDDMLGGVMVESSDGLLRIDNSYDARLKKYLEVFLPEISEKLFES